VAEGGSNDLGRDVAALAEHYHLPTRAADALVSFAKLVMDVDDLRFVRREWRAAPLGRIETSLAALDLDLVRAAPRMADIGSGIGFPGLVLAAALPQTQVALIEREAGRCEFLLRAAAEMQLPNVEVVERRVERWREGAESFDLVTCRGLAKLRVMVKKAAPLVRLDGAVVLWGRAKHDPAWESGADAAAAAQGLRPATVHRPAPTNVRGRLLYVYEKTGVS
jgi:16S rRNA (guanine527-N7)-methyltransferase